MLDIILIGIIWVITGFWISYKRDWYRNNSDVEDAILFNVIFAPLALIIAFAREFFIKSWKN